MLFFILKVSLSARVGKITRMEGVEVGWGKGIQNKLAASLAGGQYKLQSLRLTPPYSCYVISP